ncbi:MAG: methyltransferase domain-containing protein [Lentisphaerae bacterium]|nr:methyltransferase domain-containing protein [Lentisphaerota bacterium]
MNLDNAKRICARLSSEARVIDIGGGASPFARADCVIDAVAYDDRSLLDGGHPKEGERFCRESWVELDLCDRTPWPFLDNSFDFATCSHLLEDVRDPVWVCSEINRIAKAGYIEVPSRILEQSLGVEHPRYAGFYHHRWLITREGKTLCFRLKPHSIHSLRPAIVARVTPWQMINPDHAFPAFEWDGSFDYEEILEFDEDRVTAELVAFAEQCRSVSSLVVSGGAPPGEVVKKALYAIRLWLGHGA